MVRLLRVVDSGLLDVDALLGVATVASRHAYDLFLRPNSLTFHPPPSPRVYPNQRNWRHCRYPREREGVAANGSQLLQGLEDGVDILGEELDLADAVLEHLLARRHAQVPHREVESLLPRPVS